MFVSDWGRVIHLFVIVFLSNFSAYIVNPAIRDVVVDAVCSNKDECSLALYLTGFQQAIAGLGGVVMIPVLGNLSDVYGRKKLLLIPLSLAIIPLGILAWQRTTNFFYAYYVFKILTGMVTEGGVVCLALAYLADNVVETRRMSAFGILSGVVCAANLGGTLASRFLSTPHIFQVAAGVSIAAVVYSTVLLKETRYHPNPLEQPILKNEEEQSDEAMDCESSKNMNFMRRIPSPKDIICLLKSSTTFSLLACVSFFNSLAETGIQAFLLYFLKARFHFKKDQFADILLITYTGATVSSTVFLPLVGPFVGEETLIIIGLSAASLNMLIDSIAWSAWVPYAAAFLGVLFALTTPNLRSMVSKQTGPNEQGIAQGCILGITSLAYIASPLIYTPLSAIFFAEDAPAHFPGFSILCIAIAFLIGLILSISIKIIPKVDTQRDRV